MKLAPSDFEKLQSPFVLLSLVSSQQLLRQPVQQALSTDTPVPTGSNRLTSEKLKPHSCVVPVSTFFTQLKTLLHTVLSSHRSAQLLLWQPSDI